METSVNNKCKAFTSLEQSRKLAKILPHESADMCYLSDESLFPKVNYNGMVFFNIEEEKPSTIIPCWSLAALLSVLPERAIDICYVPNLQKENSKYSIAYGDDELLCIADNPVDACYEMILQLHELKLM